MINDSSRFALKTNHFLTPIPSIRESLNIKSSLRSESLITSHYRSNTNENVLSKSSK
jgi:hypothetical protein